MHLSNDLSICRLEWRPSCWLRAIVIALAVLAIVSLWLSQLPWWLRLLLAIVIIVFTARSVHKQARAPAVILIWDIAAAQIQLINGYHTQCVELIDVVLRGPMAVMRTKSEGDKDNPRLQQQVWVWLPDTLPPAARRALRLAISQQRHLERNQGKTCRAEVMH